MALANISIGVFFITPADFHKRRGWLIKNRHIQRPGRDTGADEITQQHHAHRRISKPKFPMWALHHRQYGGDGVFGKQLLAGHDHDNKAEGIAEVLQ
jgi:hypothetical protein